MKENLIKTPSPTSVTLAERYKAVALLLLNHCLLLPLLFCGV